MRAFLTENYFRPSFLLPPSPYRMAENLQQLFNQQFFLVIFVFMKTFVQIFVFVFLFVVFLKFFLCLRFKFPKKKEFLSLF